MTKHIASPERLTEVIDYLLEHNEAETCAAFNITIETLARYKAAYRSTFGGDMERRQVFQRIKERYTDAELKAIAEGGRLVPGTGRVPVIDFEGERIRYAHFSDTHFGSKYFKQHLYEAAIKECKKEGVEFIVLSGDVTEGMSTRAGHIYELTHIGYDAQFAYALELLKLWPNKWLMVNGNHDRWYMNNANAGADIVKALCEALPDADFLGIDTGDFSLKGKAAVKTWHGNDAGGSYAISYRVQKIIESFTGGEKPHVLHTGHDHKAGYFFIRHCHAFLGGAISTKSFFQSSTRKAHHAGFWIIDAYVPAKGRGINSIGSRFYPFYQ